MSIFPTKNDLKTLEISGGQLLDEWSRRNIFFEKMFRKTPEQDLLDGVDAVQFIDFHPVKHEYFKNGKWCVAWGEGQDRVLKIYVPESVRAEWKGCQLGMSQTSADIAEYEHYRQLSIFGKILYRIRKIGFL